MLKFDARGVHMSMKFLIPLVAGLALTASGCSRLAGFNEISSEKYATHSEAVERKAFESGWLPEEMPKSARQIVEVHSIDSGEMWIGFSSDGADISRFIGGCATSPRYGLPDRRRTKRNASWWPGGLTDGSDEKAQGQWDLYFCPEMHHAKTVFPAGVAVDPLSHTVWYWVKK